MMLSTFQSGLTVPYRTFFLRFGSARARYCRARAEHTPCTVRYGLFCERDMAIRFGSIKCTVRFDKCTVRLADARWKSCKFMLGIYLMNNRRSLFRLCLPCESRLLFFIILTVTGFFHPHFRILLLCPSPLCPTPFRLFIRGLTNSIDKLFV